MFKRCLTVLLFTSLVSAAAQVSTDRISYQGQEVTSVDLVASPYMDVSSVRSLLQQHAGEPYSPQKIQASIEAFKRTGMFSKVTLTVAPLPSGLKLTFVLEPAFYVGLIQFPGATKAFTYSRLLQVVNFPEQSPYEKTQLPTARATLLHFLRENGYFQAEVRTDTTLDNQQRLANLTFHVTLGKRAKIGNIQIQGTPSNEAGRLLHSMRNWEAKLTFSAVEPGKTYSPKRIQAGVHNMESLLADQHYLANRIQLNPPQYHPASNHADVSFDVHLGPKVMIRTSGASLSFLPFLAHRRLKKLLPIYDAGAIDRELVAEGRQNLIDFFQKQGYFDVKVNTTFQRHADTVTVAYNIEKGKHHKVASIAFHGNRHIDEDALMSHTAIQKHHFLSRGRFSQELLKQSVSNIEILYKDDGFESVAVKPKVVDRGSTISVTFEITEGARTLVNSVAIQGNTVPTTQLLPQRGFRLRSGNPFSPRKLAQERNRILARYLALGYLNAQVNTAIERLPDDPHRVEVTYEVTEHNKVRVNQVVILGQKRTKRSFISRAADIWPEQPLSQKDLLEGESRLYDLGIFDWASVTPRRPITTQTEEEAVIKVHESRPNSITYGFGLDIEKRGGNLPTGTVAVPGLPTIGLNISKFVSSEKTFVSPRGSLEYTRRNLFGQAQTGSVATLISRLDQRILASYTDPHYPGWSWRSLLTLSAERTSQNPLFTARLGDAAFELEKNLDRAKTTSLHLRYDFRRTVLSQLVVPQLVLPADRSVRLSTLSGTVIRDTRDKPLDPHHGGYQTLDLGITPKILGSNVNFARLIGQYARYEPLGPVVWANSIRLGMAKPFAGSRVPTSERFFAGGGTTLRGYPLNGAGPQRTVPVCSNPNDSTTCTNISIPVGGNQLFLLNSELRYPLPALPLVGNNLGGVVFYDGGNVYSNINFRQFVNNYTNTVGFGLRYSTPVGPVRVDIGRNLNPIPGISPWQFFITLGQAF